MTVTHISHFGLEKLYESETSISFKGSLGDCRRMAFAHGMEIDRLEGPTVSISGGRAIHAIADPDAPTWTHFKQGGFILKSVDDYMLLMPLAIWNNG